MNKRDFNSGKFDGNNAASFNNKPHTSWPRNKNNKIVHFNKDYAKGYIEGFKEATGIDLSHSFAF